MTTTRRHLTSVWPASALAFALALTTVIACGDDDTEAADDVTATTDAPTSDAGPDGGAFCDGLVGIEQAFREAHEDEAEIPAFVEERIEPNLALIGDNKPADIAEQVNTMTDAVERVTTTGDFTAFETPEFLAASEAVYSSLDDACDANVVDVSAVDYGYEGVPATLPAGTTSFVMVNDSAAGEAHEFSLVKLSDDTDLTLEDLLELPEAEAEQHIERFAGGVFAPAGAAAGTATELTPGRWAYVCFIPVGTVDGAEGTGPPHFVEGMAGEFTVE
jgi:hypothetical protein